MKTTEKMPDGKKRPEKVNKSKGSLLFLAIAIVALVILFAWNRQKGMEAARYFYHLFIEILPFLFLVFLLMVLVRLFLKPEILKKHMGKESGIKGWLLAIVAGIVSVGALYMWYPLLKDLIKRGVKPGLVAVFLYNRGVKLHWLPLMAFYFGVKYVVILTVVTIAASVLQGIIIDFVMRGKSFN